MSTEDRLVKIKIMGTQWEQNNNESFKELSEKMKQQILSQLIA